MLAQITRDTSSMLLALLWRLENTSKHFFDFDKMTVQFISVALFVLTIFDCIGFWLNAVDWQTKNDLHLGPSSPNYTKSFPKLLTTTASISRPTSRLITHHLKDILKKVLYFVCRIVLITIAEIIVLFFYLVLLTSHYIFVTWFFFSKFL